MDFIKFGVFEKLSIQLKEKTHERVEQRFVQTFPHISSSHVYKPTYANIYVYVYIYIYVCVCVCVRARAHIHFIYTYKSCDC